MLRSRLIFGNCTDTHIKVLQSRFIMKTKKVMAAIMQGIIIALLVVLTAIAAFAQEMPVKDVEISIILADEINASQGYSELFYLKNLDDETGVDDGLELEVSYFVYLNGSIRNESHVNKTLNSYSKSNMGTILLEEPEEYSLCVNITALNYIDLNESNNEDCINLTVKGILLNLTNSTINETNITFNETVMNESNLTINDTIEINTTINITNETNTTANETIPEQNMCGCGIAINTGKNIYDGGDKIKFSFDFCREEYICTEKKKPKSYPYEVEYWIENLDGAVKKKRLNTTSPAEKTYTPAVMQGAYIIKAIVHACNETVYDKVVLVKGEPIEQKAENLTVTSMAKDDESVSEGLLRVNIKGYKADSQKTLISVWVEKDGKKYSETTKLYVNQKNSEFDFDIPVRLKKLTKTDEYSLVADGLGMNSTAEIILSGEPEEEKPVPLLPEPQKKVENKATPIYSPPEPQIEQEQVPQKVEEPPQEIHEEERSQLEDSKETVLLIAAGVISMVVIFKKEAYRLFSKKTKIYKETSDS